MDVRSVDWVGVLRENAISTYVDLGRCAPNAILEKTAAYCVCRSGLKHPLANFAIGLNLSPARAARLKEHFRAASYFRAYVLPGDSRETVESLIEIGATEKYRLIGMGLMTDPVPVVDDSEPTRTQSEIRSAADFVVSCFFGERESVVRKRIATVLSNAATLNHTYYMCRDSIGPSAVATLTSSASADGLYNVCVREDVRGTGIGTRLVSRLSQAAWQKGVPLVLQCEPGLTAWYARLGFRPIGDVVAYGL